MSEDLQIAVDSPEAAAELQNDFDELLARVNGDMMFHSMTPNDPISVEAAIAAADRSIDAHLRELVSNKSLQQLAPQIKERFRRAIQAQAETHT